MGLGVALIWGALGVLGYRLGWQSHSRHGQHALLQSAGAAVAHGRATRCTTGVVDGPTSDGRLTGVLTIPRLGVTAPVEQGTGDAVLDVAVGHANTTPLPGTAGTSVLLAHDVSYFAKVDQLVPGDLVDYASGCLTYRFRVMGHQIVAAGAPIPALSQNALVLDTCWPTNALWYTPSRYLVEATETAVKTRVGTPHPTRSGSASPRTWPTNYGTPAPPPLLAEGLDLAHNEQPMGRLRLTDTADRTWGQSPAPLAVEGAALQTYFGALHAASERRSDWWGVLAPSVVEPPVLEGASVSGHDAPLDVTIAADRDTPTTVVLDTVVALSGGVAPGAYHEKVTEAVEGLTLVVTGWEVDHV